MDRKRLGRMLPGDAEHLSMAALQQTERDMLELELALLRRGVDQRVAGQECCSRCQRAPLIGERVYVYDRDHVLCELCRRQRTEPPRASHLVHTPAFGQTLRILQRAA